jgi:hypothetical protein
MGEGWREFGPRDLRTVDDYLELTYRDREPGRDGLASRLRC